MEIQAVQSPTLKELDELIEKAWQKTIESNSFQEYNQAWEEIVKYREMKELLKQKHD